MPDIDTNDSQPTPQVDYANGRAVTITLPQGSYITYVMAYRVSDSATGEVIAERQGLTAHEWLQTATPDELAFVLGGAVDRIAQWAAGVR